MKKVFLLVIVAAALVAVGVFLMQPTQTPNSTLTSSPSPAPAQNETAGACPSTAKDIDGNVYNTVKIGEQCWLKENLKVIKNPQGKAITRYCYDNDPKICETDGGLYDWNTAMNGPTEEGAQGICPDGWHIPRDSEWYTLENYLKDPGQICSAARNDVTSWPFDSCKTAGTKLKSGGSSGFESILAGFRLDNDSFYYRGEYTHFWSSTELKENEIELYREFYAQFLSMESGANAWARYLISSSSAVTRSPKAKSSDLSVRCLKD